MNIILIGFMGSGKTTVGRMLATRLGCSFFDTDLYIEEQADMKISDIFTNKGEDAFRALEFGMLKKIVELEDTVISTGGGLPIPEENRIYLKEAGIVVYLEACEDTLWHRLSKDNTRPLLSGSHPRERIHSILSERVNIYQQVADYTVTVDNRNIVEIAKEIEIIVKSA